MQKTKTDAGKDRRYHAVKVLIDAGDIESIIHIFDFIPKTIVCNDLHINRQRFNQAIHNPSLFKKSDLEALAKLIGTSYRKLSIVARKGSRRQLKRPNK